MRDALLLAALLASSAACSAYVTRTVVVDPKAAAATRERAVVVDVQRGGRSLGLPSGVVTSDGSAVVTERGRTSLRSDDAITLRVWYGEGDAIPGEGVVRRKTSGSMMMAGGVLLAAGTAETLASIGFNTACNGGWSWSLACAGTGVVELVSLFVSPALALTGLVLLAVGGSPHTEIDKADAVAFVPVVGPGQAGGFLRWSY